MIALKRVGLSLLFGGIGIELTRAPVADRLFDHGRGGTDCSRTG